LSSASRAHMSAHSSLTSIPKSSQPSATPHPSLTEDRGRSWLILPLRQGRKPRSLAPMIATRSFVFSFLDHTDSRSALVCRHIWVNIPEERAFSGRSQSTVAECFSGFHWEQGTLPAWEGCLQCGESAKHHLLENLISVQYCLT